MILDAKSGLRGLFVHEDTGRPVRWVIRYDTETTEFEAFRSDPEIAQRLGIDPNGLRYRGKAKLRFVPAKPISPPKPTDARDAAESYREAKLLWSKPIVIVPGQECDERGCHRLAEYRTAVERVIEPIVAADGKAYKRSIVVEVRNFCARHFRPPVRISQRGVESELEVSTRPQ